MGPRQGSPAAETLKEKLFFIGICLILLLGGFAKPCGARTAEISRSVTVVVVEPMLSLKEDTGDFSLAFKEGAAGTTSTAQSVEYRLHGNTLSSSAFDGVVSAKLSNTLEGIEVQADVGVFTNQGTPGNIELKEHAAGFQTVDTVPVPLADKQSTRTTVVNGQLPITWKATATQNLPSGSQSSILTLTLKEA